MAIDTQTPAYEHVILAPEQMAYLETRHRIEKPSESTLHFHEFVEFIYFKKVKGVVKLNQLEISLSDNSMLYIPSNLPHAFHIEHIMELHLYQCSPQLLLNQFPDVYQQLSEEPFYAPLENCYWERFNQLFDWYFKSSQRSRHQQDLLKIITWGFYELMNDNLKKNLAPPKNRDLHFFTPFIQKVDDHLNMSLDEASNLCHVTRSHFSRKFKKYFGISFSNYLEKRKLEKAKSLIINTNLSMTEIAFQSGFKDSSYFSSSFKKLTHLSPLEMRKQVSS